MSKISIKAEVSSIEQLRANARFFYESYRKCLDFEIDPNKKYGDLHIPAIVNLLFSIELLLKLVIHTEEYLKDESNYNFEEVKKSLNGHCANAISRITSHEVVVYLNENNVKEVISTESRNFVKLRYFFELPSLEINNIEILSDFFLKAYTYIFELHKSSNKPYLWSY